MNTIEITFLVFAVIVVIMLLIKRSYLTVAVVVAIALGVVGLTHSNAAESHPETIKSNNDARVPLTVKTCGRWC